MRKSLLAVNVAVIAGIAPVVVQSQETPKSFEDTVKVILFGDTKKAAARVETIVEKPKGTVITEETFTIALKQFDDNNCTATIANEHDAPGDPTTYTTMVVDFKAITSWSVVGYALVLNSSEQAPVFKSVRVEWLRVDDRLTCSKDCTLSFLGKPERAEELMTYLMNTLCPNPKRSQ